ncbi:MAG: hypothetical protein PHF14_09170, partial [Verrucomicrobiota bacterium]|nr:hypothetical protein [Verrucomicrobiota bacterium]
VASRPWLPIRPIIVEIEIEIEIGIDPCPGWHLGLIPPNCPAELRQHRNNTVAVPGSAWPNPITHPFDTDSDTDPDPELAWPLTYSDDRKLGLRKRYTLRIPPTM